MQLSWECSWWCHAWWHSHVSAALLPTLPGGQAGFASQQAHHIFHVQYSQALHIISTVIQILYWIINLLMRFTVMISLQYCHCLPTSITVSLQLCFEVTIPSILYTGTWDRENWRRVVKPRTKYCLNRMPNFRCLEPDLFFICSNCS